jgi:hypothetical protein
MNIYYVKIPYSCATYGVVKGYVYANSEDEAEVLVGDIDNIKLPENNKPLKALIYRCFQRFI